MPSRRFGGPLFFVMRQNPSFLDSYPSLGPLISRTTPIKVPFINVSGCKKNFACFRYEQGSKTKKLVITNFQFFCKHQTLFFVVVRTGPKEDLKKKVLICMFANKLCHSTEHEGSIFSAARGKKRGFISRTAAGNRDYQIWHFLTGFILLPRVQLKASANGGKLITVPRTL